MLRGPKNPRLKLAEVEVILAEALSDRESQITLKSVGSEIGIMNSVCGSLGQEDPLEKETATHSSILAWRIRGPWDRV